MPVQGSEHASRRRKHHLPLLALRVTLALLVLSVPARISARADLFDEIFKQGQARNGAIKTLTASFVETTTSALLNKPLVASGTLAAERPAHIILRYQQPEARTVLIEGDQMTMTVPSRNLRESQDIGASLKRIQKYFVDTSPNELRSNFTVVAREADDRPNSYLVTMVPKRKQIKEGMSKLELWVDRTSLLMAAMRMTMPTGETKLMTFTDVKVNQPIDKAVFAGK